ncbi:Fe-S cluster assembly ATPase SufC [Scatolibacter rhodanostii]|uniref:Fe-S cluster assembly ATPase SufC n=1 Tax=Scatolibacter rhodanostii TaxID=2014781 RepID=UPI000C07A69E|nr:Fe-S cluster assembly ATPase SufC [Scatolibacter rhodanostii]
MKSGLLNISDLKVSVEGNNILKGLNLTINKGETHVILGPNGAGKSTLAYSVLGHPDYQVDGGKIVFEGEDITDESTDKRAKKGIFLSFQNPEEINGITMVNFLKTAKKAVSDKPLPVLKFHKEMNQKMDALSINPDYAERYINVGFSGGEKKKAEILQMLMLNPKLAILDETDSGLDVDAVKIVSLGVKEYKNEENALLIITHNARILDELDVDYVHILENGKIVRTAGRELVDFISKNGFTALENQE